MPQTARRNGLDLGMRQDHERIEERLHARERLLVTVPMDQNMAGVPIEG